MKELFEEPKFDVIFVDDVDIITSSCCPKTTDCPVDPPTDHGMSSFTGGEDLF